MYSQQRRMERYKVIYMWKIVEGLVPNCGAELAPDNPRLGRKLVIPKLKSNGRVAVQTMRENSFQVSGARLFNSIPKKIREIKQSQEDFKAALDQYLSGIPDQPRIAGLVPTAVDRVSGKQSNSLLAWTKET
jgi:hypothetical protein